MNKENLQVLIKQMKLGASTKELSELVDRFEIFLELIEKKDQPGVQEEIEAARETCFTAIEQILTSFGLNADTMQQYFDNPGNFSAEEWQKFQGIKEEYLGKEPVNNKKIKPQQGRI